MGVKIKGVQKDTYSKEIGVGILIVQFSTKFFFTHVKIPKPWLFNSCFKGKFNTLNFNNNDIVCSDYKRSKNHVYLTPKSLPKSTYLP